MGPTRSRDPEPADGDPKRARARTCCKLNATKTKKDTEKQHIELKSNILILSHDLFKEKRIN